MFIGHFAVGLGAKKYAPWDQKCKIDIKQEIVRLSR